MNADTMSMAINAVRKQDFSTLKAMRNRGFLVEVAASVMVEVKKRDGQLYWGVMSSGLHEGVPCYFDPVDLMTLQAPK